MVYKQTKSKYWWYKFTWNGELIRKSTKQTNKRVAEQMEAAFRTALAKGEAGIEDKKPVPTLADFAVRFESFVATECAQKPQTVQFYQAKTKCLVASFLGTKRLDAIQEQEIQDYVELRRRTTSKRNGMLSPASVNRELATLRRMLRLAYRWRVIRRVPAFSLLRGERVREAILSRAQERLYLEIAPEPLRTVAIILLDTGLRMRELLTLNWADVHLEAPAGASFGYLTVRSGNSKNSRSRNVPLTERVNEIFAGLKQKDRGLVLHRGDNTPLCQTYLNEQARKVRAALKLPKDLTPHAFRHTFGTRLGEAGADAFTIMKLMGHSSVTVSQRYVHPTPESVNLAFSRFQTLQNESRNQVGILLGIPDSNGSQSQRQVI
jgi:integrase